MKRAEKFRFWFPVILYASLIFSLSATPDKYIPELFPGADKISHFLEYLPLGFLTVRAILKSARVEPFHSLLIAGFMVLLFSLSDEVHQIFVPGRSFDLLDAFFDLCGSVTGSILYRWRR